MKRIAVILLSLAVTLVGCATPSGATKHADSQLRLALLAEKAGKGGALILEVPSTSNSISNAMVIAALKAGAGSNAVDALVAMLKDTRNTTVGVVGGNDEVTVATVEAALKRLAGSPANNRTLLLFLDDARYGDDLEPLARLAGVTYEVVLAPK